MSELFDNEMPEKTFDDQVEEGFNKAKDKESKEILNEFYETDQGKAVLEKIEQDKQKKENTPQSVVIAEELRIKGFSEKQIRKAADMANEVVANLKENDIKLSNPKIYDVLAKPERAKPVVDSPRDINKKLEQPKQKR